MYKLLFIITYIIYNVVYAEMPRIWTRIPNFYVKNRVNHFINKNRINNCYEFQETPNSLLLKCWRNNKLTNVEIKIDGERKKQKYFGLRVSI